VIECVPAPSAAVLKLARPLASTLAVPSTVVPSVNVTVPGSAPSWAVPALTVAVKVSF
jgi:hypothetical protein